MLRFLYFLEIYCILDKKRINEKSKKILEIYQKIMIKIVRFIQKYCYAFFCSCYLFTFGMLQRKHRIFLSTITAHFGYDTIRYIPTLELPAIPWENVIKEKVPFRIYEPSRVDGNITFLELVIINIFVAYYTPKKLFEIGTFDGRTSFNMVANAPDDAVVYTLDLPSSQSYSPDKKFIPHPARRLRFKGTSEEKKIKILYGDSMVFDYIPYQHSMDLIFIDGAHTYEYVMNDSFHAYTMAKPGSIILWHDYGSFQGVTRALHELYQTQKEYKNLKHIEGTSLVYLIV